MLLSVSRRGMRCSGGRQLWAARAYAPTCPTSLPKQRLSLPAAHRHQLKRHLYLPGLRQTVDKPASASAQTIIAACRFAFPRHWISSSNRHSQLLRDQITESIISHGGAVDAELDPASSTHLVVERDHPPPPLLRYPLAWNDKRRHEPDLEGDAVVVVREGYLAPPPPPLPDHLAWNAKRHPVPGQQCRDIEDVNARNSRRVNVVYSSYIAACIQRGKLLTREDDPDRKLLSFDCSALVAQERARAAHYDFALLDVNVYKSKWGGTYDPEVPEAQRAPIERADDGVPDFAVASLARRSNVQVGEVVRVALIAGQTQQVESARRHAEAVRERERVAREQEKGQCNAPRGRQEVESLTAEPARAETKQGDRVQEPGEEADEGRDEAQGKHESDEEERAEEAVTGPNTDEVPDDPDCIDQMQEWEYACSGAWEEDETIEWPEENPDEYDPDAQPGEKAFMRIVDRRMHPTKPDTVISYTAIQLSPSTVVYGSQQWGRVKLKPRHIISVCPLYESQDVEETHARYPDTFHIPSLEERSSYKVGDLVKCVFQQEDAVGSLDVERMWVRICKVEQVGAEERTAAARQRTRGGMAVTRSASRNSGAASPVQYLGWLTTHPLCIVGLAQFEVLPMKIEPRHICATYADVDGEKGQIDPACLVKAWRRPKRWRWSCTPVSNQRDPKIDEEHLPSLILAC